MYSKFVRLWSQIPYSTIISSEIYLIIFLIFVFFLQGWQEKLPIFKVNYSSDYMADFIAVLVGVMAVLIPLSIELWRNQTVLKNLSQRSTLDASWRRINKWRYLNAPLFNMAVFLIISLVIPLFVQNSITFYLSIMYGLFLISYLFYIVFYQSPEDIYSLNIFDDTGNPNNSKALSELVELSIGEDSRLTHDSIVTRRSTSEWEGQVTQERTLQKFGSLSDKYILRNDNNLFNRDSYWKNYNQMIESADLYLLWRESYQGTIKDLVSNDKFYINENIRHSRDIFTTISLRFGGNMLYEDTLNKLFISIPVSGLEVYDLKEILSRPLISILETNNSRSTGLREMIPNKWFITNASLADNNMPFVLSLIFYDWVESSKQEADLDVESKIANAIDVIFPDVEPMLFAKFLFTRIYVIDLFNYDFQRFIDSIDKWRFVGHIGRVSPEWNPSSDENESFKLLYKRISTQEVNTTRLIPQLNWFNFNKKDLKTIATSLRILLSIEDIELLNIDGWLVVLETIERIAYES